MGPRAKGLTKITRKERKEMKNAKVECRGEREEKREEEKGDLHSHGLCPYPLRSTSSPEYVEPPDIPGGD
jgi:hypothetical protein